MAELSFNPCTEYSENAVYEVAASSYMLTDDAHNSCI